MVYGIVYRRTKKRVLMDGKLIPIFDYPRQAEIYIDKILYGSPYVTIKNLGGK